MFLFLEIEEAQIMASGEIAPTYNHSKHLSDLISRILEIGRWDAFSLPTYQIMVYGQGEKASRGKGCCCMKGKENRQ